jgi:hypothetical protein
MAFKFSDLPLPDLNTTIGFFFYSFLTYIFIMVAGWMFNPPVGKGDSGDHQTDFSAQGAKMRAENLKKRKATKAKKA